MRHFFVIVLAFFKASVLFQATKWLKFSNNPQKSSKYDEIPQNKTKNQ